MTWLDGIAVSMDMSLSILQEIVKDREACLATVHGVAKSRTRLKRLSSSSRVCSNSYPLSRLCHPTISSSIIPFFSCLQSFPVLGSFSNESALCIRWPKYWSFNFSISPSSEYLGLISFRIDWFDLQTIWLFVLEKAMAPHSSTLAWKSWL